MLIISIPNPDQYKIAMHKKAYKTVGCDHIPVLLI